MNLEQISEELYQAEKSAKPLTAFSARGIELSLTDAYAIQGCLEERALSEGDQVCGYKMGLTSKAKQRDVQVFEPIRGFLKKSSELVKGATIDLTKRIHPRVEPEVAVVLKERLRGPRVTVRDVHQSLGGVYPALEIVDSRYENFSFKLPDVIADNTSAAHFLLGSTNLIGSLEDMRLWGVTVKKNGKIVETGAPAAVLGDPLLSVVGLANSLGAQGKEIPAGMVILTGGITNSVSFQKGDYLEVIWPMEQLTLFT